MTLFQPLHIHNNFYHTSNPNKKYWYSETHLIGHALEEKRLCWNRQDVGLHSLKNRMVKWIWKSMSENTVKQITQDSDKTGFTVCRIAIYLLMGEWVALNFDFFRLYQFSFLTDTDLLIFLPSTISNGYSFASDIFNVNHLNCFLCL